MLASFSKIGKGTKHSHENSVKSAGQGHENIYISQKYKREREGE